MKERGRKWNMLLVSLGGVWENGLGCTKQLYWDTDYGKWGNLYAPCINSEMVYVMYGEDAW